MILFCCPIVTILLFPFIHRPAKVKILCDDAFDIRLWFTPMGKRNGPWWSRIGYQLFLVCTQSLWWRACRIFALSNSICGMEKDYLSLFCAIFSNSSALIRDWGLRLWAVFLVEWHSYDQTYCNGYLVQIFEMMSKSFGLLCRWLY